MSGCVVVDVGALSRLGSVLGVWLNSRQLCTRTQEALRAVPSPEQLLQGLGTRTLAQRSPVQQVICVLAVRTNAQVCKAQDSSGYCPATQSHPGWVLSCPSQVTG